jgi:hypothetical protein
MNNQSRAMGNSRNEESHVMPIHAEGANRSTTVDPAKLFEKVRRWCPSSPVEVPIALVNLFIEAAASGGLGQLRLSLLEDYVLGLDGELCPMAEKINRLKKATVRMAGDPSRLPKLRSGRPAPLAKATLTAIERTPDQLLGADQVHTVLRRVKPKISLESTYAVLKRMTDSGLLERDNAGVYRLPNCSKESYEPRTTQLLRLVYEAPDHKMSVRQAESVLDWSAKLLSATASELRSRSLLIYEKRELAVPGEIVEKVARGEGVRIAPGKMFYGQAGGRRS